MLGGAGGVPSIAIQLARVLTGLTVIGTASRPESAEWVRARGAHHVVDHSQAAGRPGQGARPDPLRLLHPYRCRRLGRDRQADRAAGPLRPDRRPGAARPAAGEVQERLDPLGGDVHPADVPHRGYAAPARDPDRGGHAARQRHHPARPRPRITAASPRPTCGGPMPRSRRAASSARSCLQDSKPRRTERDSGLTRHQARSARPTMGRNDDARRWANGSRGRLAVATLARGPPPAGAAAGAAAGDPGGRLCHPGTAGHAGRPPAGRLEDRRDQRRGPGAYRPRWSHRRPGAG